MNDSLPAGACARADTASAWVPRWSHLVRPGGSVLDVACGEGRHLAWFARLGCPVVGVDRSADALAAVDLPRSCCETVQADIEQGPWPFDGRAFDAVVVTNYLWRPLLPTLAGCLAPGAVLIYETFARGQETIGRPARPEFLLEPGELLRAFAGLRPIAFEDGFEPGRSDSEPGRFVQRLVAVRPADAQAPAPPRYRLGARP